MVALQTSSTIQRNADWDFSFQIQQGGPCSEYSDLTDWVFTCALRTSAGASLTTPAIYKPTADVLSLRLTNEQTALFSTQFGASLVINAKRPDGFDYRLIEARITIS